MREEYSNSKSASEKKITGLTLQLQEKTTRLETYDRLEAELDKVVVQAAALPSNLNIFLIRLIHSEFIYPNIFNE